MNNKHLMILLAEDDDGHAQLIQRNLKRAGVVNEIVRVRDGQEALDFVHCQGAFADRSPSEPMLLLLDINMPKVDGIGVLKAMKADPNTAQGPVIMLTTTDDPREVDRCYNSGAVSTSPSRCNTRTLSTL
jgi:CheY-like chemotaxis protein